VVALVDLDQDGPGRDAHPDEEGRLLGQALQGLVGGFGWASADRRVEGAGSSGRMAGTIHRAAGAWDRRASSLPTTPITSAASSVRAGRLRSAGHGRDASGQHDRDPSEGGGRQQRPPGDAEAAGVEGHVEGPGSSLKAVELATSPARPLVRCSPRLTAASSDSERPGTWPTHSCTPACRSLDRGQPLPKSSAMVEESPPPGATLDA
jgi:hypothetical protein